MLNVRSYEERAKDFIKQVFPYIEKEFKPEWVRSCIKKYNLQFHRKVKVASGCARTALITSDYVVKFDYDSDKARQIGGCESEVRLYAQAEKDGFDYLFAKITQYDYNGRQFYIMPRIRGIGRNDWVYADAFMTKKEKEWCDAHHLSDLHEYNYGFRKGKLCIVDYACN